MTTKSPRTWWWLWALVLQVVNLPQGSCKESRINTRELERQVLQHMFYSSRYDARIRPAGYNGSADHPTIVKVNIFIRTVSRINDYRMQYDIQLTFREQWMDDRLKFDDFKGKIKYLTLTDSSRIWTPDLFFSNEREAHFHYIVLPNEYIRIFPSGAVLFSTRISMTLWCYMDLKLYPHDRQVCSIRMASYAWTTDDLVFLWKDGDPVQVVKNLHLPLYSLDKFSTDYCSSKSITGEYSCLRVDLMLKREFSYYLLHIYMPTFMLVIVSWISFWFDPKAITARTFLLVTMILTVTIQTSSARASLPVVNYVMAIEVWLAACDTFVFAALIQLALVNYLCRCDARRRAAEQRGRHVEPDHSEEDNDVLDEDVSAAFAIKLLEEQSAEDSQKPGSGMNPSRKWWRAWATELYTPSQRIDVISRIAFPLAFSLFCVVYWCAYASGHNE